MTTHGEGWKTRCILFTPLPQLPSLLASLSVTELFIHCPALPFLSDTHYAHALFPSHTPTNPNMLYYRLGIYIAFRVKKQLRLSLGSGLHRSCAQAALYSCTVVRPLIHTELRIHSEQRTTTGQSWVITHHLYTWGKKAFLYVNEWTDSRMKILSMKTAGHLSWLSNLFIPSGAITYQSSKLNSLSLVSCTSTCHQSHSW